MGFGGPVWHASICARVPASLGLLRAMAASELQGVGDASAGEWEEWTGKAFHLRRRLAASEQNVTGDVKDIRGTPEVEKRLRPLRKYLPPSWSE